MHSDVIVMDSPLSYVDIPPWAQVVSKDREAILRSSSLPSPSHDNSQSQASSGPNQNGGSKSAFNIPQLILGAALQLPSQPPSSPRGVTSGPSGKLMSNKDPLSLQITTVNFTRFVAKSGPIFWVQDRVEEIVMWKKGNTVTLAWMAAYAVICEFDLISDKTQKGG